MSEFENTEYQVKSLEYDARKKQAQAKVLFIAYGSILTSVLAAALVMFGLGAAVTFVYNYSFVDLLGYKELSLYNGVSLVSIGTVLFFIVRGLLKKLGV